MIPTFIGITLLVFCVTRFVPGGPIERMMTQAQLSSGEISNSSSNINSAPLSDKQLAVLNAYYGFDKPPLLGYWHWLSNVVKFDLGTSTRYNEPVWDIIKERLPISLFYGIATLIITYAVCIPLGIAKALKHQTGFDNISSALVFIGYAVPGYVIGIAAVTLFGSHWELFPIGGISSEDFDEYSPTQKILDLLHHATLPLLAYVMGSFAVTTFMIKNSLMDNLAADYVKTAIAKGRNFRGAVFRHALRNSLIPLATSLGQSLTAILGGSFLIETIFNIDGLGLLGYESLLERDYPIVMGSLVITSMLFLLGNILSDVLVALVDPRVKFGGQ